MLNEDKWLASDAFEKVDGNVGGITKVVKKIGIVNKVLLKLTVVMTYHNQHSFSVS